MSIHFELVSPEEKLVSEPVHMAVIPGVTGEMGVGKDHASFVVALQAGVVKLFSEEGSEARNIFIAGGFADVTGENCTVLAEQAVNVNDLDKAEIEQEIANINEDLGRADDQADRTKAEKAMKLAQAKLTAITGSLSV